MSKAGEPACDAWGLLAEAASIDAQADIAQVPRRDVGLRIFAQEIVNQSTPSFSNDPEIRDLALGMVDRFVRDWEKIDALDALPVSGPVRDDRDDQSTLADLKQAALDVAADTIVDAVLTHANIPSARPRDELRKDVSLCLLRAHREINLMHDRLHGLLIQEDPRHSMWPTLWEQSKPIAQRTRDVQATAITAVCKSLAKDIDRKLALLPYFDHWVPDYLRFIQTLKDLGYRFGSLEQLNAGIAEPWVCYLRYDVHVKDLSGAYGMVIANDIANVPSVGYALYPYSNLERAALDKFRTLRSISNGLFSLAFHGSPFATWILRDRFDGLSHKAAAWNNAGGFETFVREEIRDEAGLERFLETLQETFNEDANVFRRDIGPCQTCASHGDGFTVKFEDHEDDFLRHCARAIGSFEFMNTERAQKAGFSLEVTNLTDGRDIVATIGDGDQDLRNRKFSEATSSGSPFVLLIHPELPHCGHYSFSRLTDLIQ